jgi:DNA-binding PadR family transcriptional regulator
MAPSTASLGELEHLVLLAVLQLGDDAYGAPVLELLRTRGRRDLSRGALYTVLERLEVKGMLTSEHGEAVAERGGRPRRYFQVTPRGIAALREARRALLELWSGLESRLGGAR